MASDAVHVLIASPLEAEHADRIAASDPRVRLLYEPDLLPLPRYACDHVGVKRDPDAADLSRWAELRALADVSFDFDWHALLAAAGVRVTGVGRPGHSYQVPGVTSGVDDTQLAAVLPTADALILACPLTERTRGLIGRTELGLLPPGAVVVNISRGQVVDEAALVEHLASGHLGGACLDVFDTEPLPESSPLWALPNVLISPHSASTVSAENRLLTDLFIDNLGRWLAGQPLRNTFDVNAGY